MTLIDAGVTRPHEIVARTGRSSAAVGMNLHTLVGKRAIRRLERGLYATAGDVDVVTFSEREPEAEDKPGRTAAAQIERPASPVTDQQPAAAEPSRSESADTTEERLVRAVLAAGRAFVTALERELLDEIEREAA